RCRGALAQPRHPRPGICCAAWAIRVRQVNDPQLIAGLEEASEGKLWFDNEVVNRIPPHHRDVAMVFQSYALYPHKTVYENIAFGLRMRGVASAEVERRVQDAAKKLDITSLLGRRPSQLSGGQRQRD